MLEGYITPLLMSYIDRYVKNLKPSDLKLSFWGGDAVLRNLELRLDVLEKELGVPLEFKSGCIRELVLHIPWNAIGSSPVEVTIKDIEFVIKLKSLRNMSSATTASSEKSSTDASDEKLSPNPPARPEPVPAGGEGETPAPGYLQGYLNRIINNVCVYVQNMVVKVIEEESNMMLTLNIGSMDYHTTNEQWKKEFVYTDYFQDAYSLFKLLVVRDVAINLHSIEMMEKGQGSLLHEPFVKRCAFVCRMTLEYQGKVSTKKTFEVLLDHLELGVDERQFCLFLHLSDWLLAMYYSFKKLKGRDENPYSSPELHARNQSIYSTPASGIEQDESKNGNFADAVETAGQKSETSRSGSRDSSDRISETSASSSQSQPQQQQQEDASGWGTWLLSYIGPSGSDPDISEDSQLESAGASTRREEKEKDKGSTAREPPKPTKTRFIVHAKSVTVVFKMTQHVQVPVFVRTFTSPVLRVSFAECMFRFDRCPASNLFLVCVGVGRVSGEVMGLCPCVKKFPSSWRRTSVASAIDTSLVIPVFYLGSSPPEDPSAAESVVDGETFTEASSTAPPPPDHAPLMPDSSHFPSRSSLSSKLGCDSDSLETLGRPFQAVWFSYDYRDVGAEVEVEECAEVLRVGVVCAVFSPDVVHRLELFLTAFRESVKMTPPMSAGAVVIGDPKASTHLEIQLAGLSASLTPSAHFLPTLTTLTTLKSQSFRISPKLSKKRERESHRPPSSSPSLPCLCVTLAGADADMVLPMYGKNAQPTVPQKQQVRVGLSVLKAGVFEIRELGECIRKLSAFVGGKSQGEGIEGMREKESEIDVFFCVPSTDLTYNSVVHGCTLDSDYDNLSDTSHVSLALTKASLTLSDAHISKSLFLYHSWVKMDSTPASTAQLCYVPPTCPTHLSHVHVTLSGLSLSMSTYSQFVSRSLVLEAIRMSIVREECGELVKGPPSFLPFLYGPFDTCKWNDIGHGGDGGGLVGKNKEEGAGGRLLELLVTTPDEKIAEAVFPTVQLSIAGLALHTHSTLLQYLEQLSLYLQNPATHLQSSTSAGVIGGGGGEGVATPTTPLPYTLTPTASVMEQSWELGASAGGGGGEENGLLAVVKNYAVKIKIEPVLVVLSVSETLYPTPSPDISSNLCENLPVLTQISAACCVGDHTHLTAPSTAPPTSPGLDTPLTLSATVFCLPSILLESAKNHVLDEPVPRNFRTDTLPWDCALTDMAVYSVLGSHGHQPVGSHGRHMLEPVGSHVHHMCEPVGSHVRHMLEPVGMKLTLASQQEGVGVTVDLDTVALSVSKKQIHLLQEGISKLTHQLSLLSASLSTPTAPHRTRHTSASETSLPRTHSDAPPSPGNATPTVRTASSEMSTTLSSNLYQGLSSFWLQLIVSKFIANVYGRDGGGDVCKTRTARQGSTESCSDTKFTTERCSPIRISLEVESASLQLDAQERCTDCILKVSSLECSLCKLLLRGSASSSSEIYSQLPGSRHHQPPGTDFFESPETRHPQPPVAHHLQSPGSAHPQPPGSQPPGGSNQPQPPRSQPPGSHHPLPHGSNRLQSPGTPPKTHHPQPPISSHPQTPKFHHPQPPVSPPQWVPYLENSNGKLFSSTSSNLPEEILQATTTGLVLSQFLASGGERSEVLFSPSNPPLSAKFQPVFLYLKGHLPGRSQSSKRPSVEVNVGPFEAVLWLPVCGVLSSVFQWSSAAGGGTTQQEPKRLAAQDSLQQWPALELMVESFRVILPSQDFSHCLLLNTEGVKVTSSVDFAGPEVRLVTNQNAYQRLALLSSERRQPPLPVYQLEAFSLAVWGVAREGESPTSFLCSSTATLLLTYTPPLYYSAPSRAVPHLQLLTSDPLMLATGHNVEANFVNNFCVLVGPNQVSTITNVLKVNRLVPSASKDPPLTPKDATPPSPSPSTPTIPHKLLLTGKTVALCLLPETPGPSFDSRTVAPLLVCLLHNPLGVYQTSESEREGSQQWALEGSLFNVALGYNKEQCLSLYSDWLDEENWPTSMSQILQTRPGVPKDKSTHPPNVLNAKWSRSYMKGIDGGMGSVLSVEISRPCKLSCDPVLVRECAEVLSQLLLARQDRVSCDSDSLGPHSGGVGSLSSGLQDSEGEGHHRDMSSVVGLVTNADAQLDVRLSSVQVVLEFLSSSITSKSAEAGGTSAGAEGAEAGARSTSPVTLDREGVLVAWDTLLLSATHKRGYPSATVTVHAAQLSSMWEESLVGVVPPTELEVAWRKHVAASPLDMDETNLSLSCELLDFRLCQRDIELLHRLTRRFLESVPSPPQAEGGREELGKEGVGVFESEGLGLPVASQSFEDDLRVLDFVYVVEESECPRLPGAGEIVFHNGSPALVPSMTWQYWEPRAVSRLHMLPIPLPVSHQENSPIAWSSLKIGCALEYYSEVTLSFAVLHKCFLSESVPSEAVVDQEGQCVSRIWRLSITHIQWFSEEEGRLEIVLCNEPFAWTDQATPLAPPILSPLTLAASTRVDSHFSPSSLSSSSLSLHCRTLQLTLLHHCYGRDEGQSAKFKGYRIVSYTTPVEPHTHCQELLKFGAKDIGALVRVMRQSGLQFTVDGVYSLEFVDFGGLLWRKAVSASRLIFSLETSSSSLDTTSSHYDVATVPEVKVHVWLEPCAVKLSQGLTHTLYLTYHLWRDTLDLCLRGQEVEGGSGTSCDVVIPEYYVLCNDTNVDLIMGQSGTDEELSLPCHSCLSYSWYSHTPPSLHKLRLSLVPPPTPSTHPSPTSPLTPSPPPPTSWSDPVSVDTLGVSVVLLPMGASEARAYVEVTELGGMQKQVVVYGEWKFFSTLTHPVDVKLTISSSDSGKKHVSASSHSSPSTSSPSTPLSPPSLLSLPLPLTPPFLPSLRASSNSCSEQIFSVLPGEATPSVLAPKDQVGGVSLRAPGMESWSKPYPLPHSEGWNKPQLLVELPGKEGSGMEAHFWFNVKCMGGGASRKSWGHKVTFSPLFVICNHLPVDLTMVASDNRPEATPQGLSQVTALLVPTSPVLIGGDGGEATLTSLCADTWYNLTFRRSDISAASRPPVSLSTFLLRHLPISPSPSSPSSPLPPSTSTSSLTTTSQFTLPLDPQRERQCRVRASLFRSCLNTISLHLRAEYVMVNETRLTFDLVEPRMQTVGGKGEEVGEEEEEVCVQLGPSCSRIVCQSEIALRLEHNDSPYISTLVTLPNLWGKGKGKSKASSASTDQNEEGELPDVLVTLTPVAAVALGHSKDQQDTHVVVGKVLLSYQNQHTTLTASIKPAFVFHNKSPHTVSIAPCVTEKGTSPSLLPSLSTPPHLWGHHQAKVVETLQPGMSEPLLFWNLLNDSQSNRAVTHSLLLTGHELGNLDKDSLWSIHLSTNFVRHSFSLPIHTSPRAFAACLLTTHENEGVTYIVLQEDPAPKICIQNHTSAEFHVMECGAIGLSAVPQTVPSCCEVIYEPPSLAKLYPVVYDEDIASEQDKRLQRMAKNVKIRLRCGGTEVKEGWSNPFLLTQNDDQFLEVPGFGRVLVSANSHTHHTFISLIPVGTSPSLQLTSQLAPTSHQPISRDLKVKVDIRQFVISLFDDAQRTEKEAEVLRFVASDLHFSHSRLDKEGAKVELTLRSLRVDNMTVQSLQEFAVAFLPRCEHAPPLQLVKKDFPPLLKLLVEYNPHASFQISSIHLSIQPVTFHLEDSLLQRLKAVSNTYSIPSANIHTVVKQVKIVSSSQIPLVVLQEAKRDAHPVCISSLIIEDMSVYVSANVTLKAYLSCRDTLFSFSRYELANVFSNWSEVSQIIAARYVSAVFMHIGWVLGSLELIGSPITFIQSINRGVSDLVRLPYEGLTRSPGLFLVGIGQGTASFLHQFSSGALSSITHLASSIARNMERLSMDPDHMSYQDRQRREQPATHFTQGVASGVSSFALSIMSAVAGLVDQPMQSFQRMEESDGTTSTLLKGFGKGLLGVVTKPVGGAMDLVSKAGQGIMSDTGLARKLSHCELVEGVREFVVGGVGRRELVRTCGGYVRRLGHISVLSACVADLLLLPLVPDTGAPSSRHSCVLLLTPAHLVLWDVSQDTASHKIAVSSCVVTTQHQDHQMELRISVTEPSSPLIEGPGEFREGKGVGLELVRQFLQQASVEEVGEESCIDQDHPFGVEPSGFVDLEGACTTGEKWEGPEEGEEGAGVLEEGEGGGGDGVVVLCVEAGQGGQLLALLQALQRFYSHPQDMYTVQW